MDVTEYVLEVPGKPDGRKIQSRMEWAQVIMMIVALAYMSARFIGGNPFNGLRLMRKYCRKEVARLVTPRVVALTICLLEIRYL